MYRTIQDFQQDWSYESDATLRVFKQLTSESLGQKVTEDGRSLGFIAWHIVSALSDMIGRAGLPVHALADKTEIPASAMDIVEVYEKTARSVIDAVLNNWQDETLLEEREMYGDVWKNGATLSILIRHQTHHRGQMTILMRQAGLTVPGVYGPAREEWAQWGLPAHE